VSPLWRDQVRIFLSPQRALLLRLKRGLHPRVVAKASLSCAPQPGEPPWQASLRALEPALAKPEWRGANAVAVLSGHFMRHVLVPWSDALGNECEQIEYARHCFAKVYGRNAEAWDLRLSLETPGETHVAAAVDRSLIEALPTLCRQNQLRLVSIQPYLMAVFNAWRERFRDGSRWLVLIEHDRLCVALLEAGRWRWLRHQRMDNETLADIGVWLAREQYLAGAPETARSVLLYAPEAGHLAARTGAWSIERLTVPACPGFSPVDDAPYSMAMNG